MMVDSQWAFRPAGHHTPADARPPARFAWRLWAWAEAERGRERVAGCHYRPGWGDDVARWTWPTALPILVVVTFRDRLLATIRAAKPVLEAPGVMVVGSEVPNLLEPGAAATLIVSQDLDVGVPVEHHAEVKRQVAELHAFRASPEEPSVWVPREPGLLEVNFIGMDPTQDPAEAYVLDDDQLPLLVFGALSLVSPGVELDLMETRVRLPRAAGLVLEKLVTDRTGEKGERDLLVALGLLMTATPDDIDEVEIMFRRLRPELRHVVRSNLTILSLLEARPGMPDPGPHRADVAALLRRLEGEEGSDP